MNRDLEGIPVPKRVPQVRGPIKVGSSIGTVDGVDRGTTGVYLVFEEKIRIFAAAHVVRSFTIPDNLSLLVEDITMEPGKIICPGKLDLLKFTHTL